MIKKVLIAPEVNHIFRSWALGLALVLAFLSTATVLASGSVQQSPVRSSGPEMAPLASEPALGITKTVSALEVLPGDLVTYTLVVSNAGDADATEVVISDTLPEHTLFAWAGEGTPTPDGKGVEWSGKTVTAGQQLTVTFTVTVTSPLTNGTEIVNDSYGVTCTEGVSSTGQPVTVTVTGEPLLSIAKTPHAPTLSPGERLTYTLVVSNHGHIHATGATVTDTIPAYTQFAWADEGGSWDGGQVVWGEKKIKGGKSLTLTFAVTVTSPLTDGVEIVNDSYGVTCTEGVSATGQPVTVTVTGEPLLSIAKTPHAPTLSPGERLTYTLVVSNHGHIHATGATVTDTIPAHTQFAWADEGGDLVGGQVVWSGRKIEGGKSLTVTFAVTLDSPLDDGTPIVNDSYGVTCSQGVSASGEPATVTVGSAPVLSILKTASHDSVSPGDLLTYEIVVSNDGDENATGVVISDTLPEHTQFHSASTGSSPPANGQVVWTGLEVTAGTSLTAVLTVTVDTPLTDGTLIVNDSYEATCSHGVGAVGEAVAVTVRLHYVYLPLLLKGFATEPPPDECNNIIENGDFENEPDHSAHWDESSAGGWDLIYPKSQMPVHGGGWGAWLAGYNNARDELCQGIEIPEGRTSATATWWWRVRTIQTGSLAVDTIRLEVRGGDGPDPVILSNLDKPSTWISDTIEIPDTGVLTLCFVADTDGNLTTDFYVDDVAVEVCVPGE